MPDPRQSINKMKTMKMTKTLFTVGCFLPALALANDVRGNGLSYDYVGIGYAQVRQTTTLRGSLMGVTI